MRKPLVTFVILSIVVAGLALTGAGCSKKVVPPPPVAKAEPPPPPPPPAPAPTINLSASPSTVERGQSTTLSWSSNNATGVSIDGGIGTVEASGRRTITPGSSTTYRARATGPGGNATAETRVTVTEPPPVAPPPPRAISDSEFWATNVKDIFFDYDSYALRDDARDTLTGNARALQERQGLKGTIEGHCDERGSEKYNLALGDRRANAAKSFLVSQGVAADRLDTLSIGEDKPFVDGHDEAAWSQNRRAHFVLK